MYPYLNFWEDTLSCWLPPQLILPKGSERLQHTSPIYGLSPLCWHLYLEGGQTPVDNQFPTVPTPQLLRGYPVVLTTTSTHSSQGQWRTATHFPQIWSKPPPLAPLSRGWPNSSTLDNQFPTMLTPLPPFFLLVVCGASWAWAQH